MSSTASRPFDADADGLIMSEGYVAVVMKTLERALADGDPIQAVVRGLGVATDGRGKSLWAPRKEGQIKAMQQAYRSGVDMAGLQYLECHATATQLGDATELETLGEVLGPKMPPGKRIAITSVKANIGHSLEAAGVAGLIKTVLCMQHRDDSAGHQHRNAQSQDRLEIGALLHSAGCRALDGSGRRRAATGGGQCLRHRRLEHARRDRRIQRDLPPQTVGQPPSARRVHRGGATVRPAGTMAASRTRTQWRRRPRPTTSRSPSSAWAASFPVPRGSTKFWETLAVGH